jgi:glycosyltransferase involved in cell wall biosynthesis
MAVSRGHLVSAEGTRRRSVEHVAVVVPANNEGATVAATLESIDDARRQLDGDVTSTVVVVLDACTDDTLARVMQLRQRATAPLLTAPSVVHIEARSAGAARAAGFARALHAAPVCPERMWIATTDADTVVPSDWLRSQLASAEDGLDAIAGIVDLGPDAPLDLRRRFSSRYALVADGSHRHVHGANMGMRGSAYLASGGWAAIETGEDQELWRRLGEVGRCVASTSVSVRTSARLVGRAPNGFAADLRALIEDEIVA